MRATLQSQANSGAELRFRCGVAGAAGAVAAAEVAVKAVAAVVAASVFTEMSAAAKRQMPSDVLIECTCGGMAIQCWLNIIERTVSLFWSTRELTAQACAIYCLCLHVCATESSIQCIVQDTGIRGHLHARK